MSNYDASIRVNTKVDTSQMQRLQIQIDKSTDKVERLTNKLEELRNKKAPTEEFAALERKLQSAQEELQKLNDQKAKFVEIGFGEEMLSGTNREISAAQRKIESITAEMQKMKDAGKAFTLEDTSDEAEKVEKELSIAKKELHALLTKQKELNRVAGHTPEGYRKLASSARGAFNTLVTGSRKAHGPLTKVQQRLSSIAMSALLFNQVSRGLNSAVNGAKEGFQNLAKYSSETNKVMSEFKGEIETTKNSLAVAFEPIVTTVVPYLTQFLDVVNSAGNSLAWFLAILSGKNTYKRAKDQVVDYAESLNTAGSAAKNALASFDDLNTLAQSGSGSGSTSPSDMFEEVETGVPDDWTAGLVDAINMGDWESAGKLLAEKLNNSAEQIDYYKIGATIGKGLTNAFAAGNGFLSNVDTLSIGAGLATMLNTAMENLDEELVGKTAAETINRIFDAAFGFLSTFDFKSAGLELGGIINGFFENVDFGEAGQNVSLLAAGILEFFTNAVEETNWAAVGEKIGEFFANIDWFNILIGSADLVASSIRAVFKTACGMVNGLFGPDEKQSIADQISAAADIAYQSVIDDFEGLKKISDEWYVMSQNYNNLTDEQKKKVEEYASVLSERLGIAAEDIDSVTGAYMGTKESLDKLIKSTESYYMILGAQSIMTQLYEDRSNAMINLDKATGDFQESLEALSKSQIDGYYLNLDWSKSTEDLAQDFVDLYNEELLLARSRNGILTDQWNAIEASYAYATAILDQKEAISTCDEEIAIAQGVINSYSNDVVVAGGTMSNSWATGTTALKKHAEETQSSMSTMSNAWATGSIVAKRTAIDNQTAVTDISTAWQDGETNICSAVDGITSGMQASFESTYDELQIKTKAFLDELHRMFDDYSVGVSGVAIGGAAFVAADLPQYASGAVFSGGKPYVAVVNDQPMGQTNVEAPLSVIEDAVRDVMQEGGGYNTQISLEVDGRTFAKLMYPYMQSESRRIGVNFRNN